MSTLTVGTISEKVSGNGVTIDGVNLKDGDVTIADKIIHDGDTNTAIRFPSADTVTIETGGSEVFRVDANGHITKPLQSAFSVHKNVSTQSNISNSGDQLVTFSTERFDVNSDFDTSTSTFTAPVTGKYFLSVSCRFSQFDIDADYIILFISTSNETYRVLIDPNFTADLNFFSMTSTVLADMDAGDTATVGYSQSGGLPQVDIVGNTDYTYFTGCLVC